MSTGRASSSGCEDLCRKADGETRLDQVVRLSRAQRASVPSPKDSRVHRRVAPNDLQ
jgi:hypothetical protein